MRRNFLKTIYFDNSKLWNKDNIEKLYEEDEYENAETQEVSVSEYISTGDEYIKNIPIFQNIEELELNESITYFVWENGSWKSTLMEHIATTIGFNKEWWTKNTLYNTNKIDNLENNWITLSWQPAKFLSGYFFRAEWIYNFVNYLQNIEDWFAPYWWENLHNLSHGQQFMRIFESQMDTVWIYILDEIESALSPQNQLKVIEMIKYMVSKWSQFLIASHSPIILSIKENSQILSCDDWEIHEINYDSIPCVDMYRRILKA